MGDASEHITGDLIPDESYGSLNNAKRKKIPKKYDRFDAIHAYEGLIRGRMNGKERDHFVAFFNYLIEREWSLAGLRFIKDNAWKRINAENNERLMPFASQQKGDNMTTKPKEAPCNTK